MFDIRWYAKRNRYAHTSQLDENIANKRHYEVARFARKMQRQLQDMLPDDLLGQKEEFHNAVAGFLSPFFIKVEESEAEDRIGGWDVEIEVKAKHRRVNRGQGVSVLERVGTAAQKYAEGRGKEMKSGKAANKDARKTSRAEG